VKLQKINQRILLPVKTDREVSGIYIFIPTAYISGTASPFTAFSLGGGGATPAAPAPLSSLLGSQVSNNGGATAPSLGSMFSRPPGASEASKDQSKDSTANKDGPSAGQRFLQIDPRCLSLCFMYSISIYYI
jgi:hypothetical protein